MDFEVVPAHELLLADQAKVFKDAFAGYLIGSIEMDAAGLGRFVCAQGVDLCFSRFVRKPNAALAGFGYINRTGNVPRLGAMGIAPNARRTGAAAYLLSHLLEEAKERGDKAMVLEVFEQNTPAHSLYRRFGFRELTRLFGWRCKGNTITTAQELCEISPLTAMRMSSVFEYPDMPWQISRYAVAKLSGARVFCLNNAAVVIGDPDLSPVRVHAFFGHDADNWSSVRNVMAAVLQKFPGSEFFAPPIFPEQFGVEIFGPLGFIREPLNQFLMRCDL